MTVQKAAASLAVKLLVGVVRAEAAAGRRDQSRGTWKPRKITLEFITIYSAKGMRMFIPQIHFPSLTYTQFILLYARDTT